MKILQKGTFLGNITRIYYKEAMTFSITDYLPEDLEANCRHYHEHPNISFILTGGNIEKRANLEREKLAGAVMFYYAGEEHQNIRKLFPAKSLNFEIEFPFLKQFNVTEALIARAVNKNQDSKFLLLNIYNELLADDQYTSLSIQLLLLDLMNQTQKLESQKEWPKWIRRVYELIHDRWNETISLSELSSIAQVSPITISKHFPRFFNCTLGEYMRKLKVEKSLHLIKSKDKSLTDIALYCGFADQSHFIRTFKQLTKFSPSQYKKL